MNKIILSILVILFFNNCSFNENSKIWKNKDKNLANQKNIKKIFNENEKLVSELNPQLKLDLSNIETGNKAINNQNNIGSQTYKGSLIKSANYKFSTIDDINGLNLKPVFLNDGLIFFNNKGSIIKYNNDQKIVWEKNYYSKSEKKLKPKLYFANNNENLIIIDNISKYYSVNINTGELNWSKANAYPFNSEIKLYKEKFFAVDYKNTLRCYNISNGSECWNLPTQDSFTLSNAQHSVIIINNLVIFSNSIGEITSVDIETGLIIWQVSTQSVGIVNEAFKFKTSKLVSDGNSIFFSNNRNEFYSIDVNTGTTNWTNEINSNLTPVIIDKLIFTVSNDGYLFIVEKDKGNIVRINDLLINHDIKKRKYIRPIGFAIGEKNLFLTFNNGKVIVVNLEQANILYIEKVSGDYLSEPFIFNEKLYIIKNGSIIVYS
ncbi:MAG: dehydrogenase [Pelagibacteraceae bacterium]|nr:dehydrogenase [Pelagibacteraceae bacterium]PHX89436.1 MAG: dehydrogenase [Pelagibacteraceae bacterium]